jgi:hypothetical protein
VTNTADELVFQVTKDGVCGVSDTITAPNVKATTVTTETLVTESEVYSTQELQSTTFAFRPEHAGIIQQNQPNEANFLSQEGQRQIASLQGVYPLHIAVGGWVMWDLNVLAFSGNSFFSGIIFENPATEYIGFKIGADVYGHNVTSVIVGGNVLFQDGIPITSSTPTAQISVGLWQVRITRTSADVWTVSFPGFNETVQFGTERANQMFYLVICDLIFGLSNLQVSVTGFSSQDWIPEDTKYTFAQDKDNTLRMTSGGQDVITYSTSGVEVGSSLRTAGSVTTHAAKFGYPCFVSSVFYMAYGGYNMLNTVVETAIHDKPARVYGRPFIPNHIRGGQNYRIRIRGRIGTFGIDVPLTFRIYLGPTLIGMSQPADVAKNLVDKYFDIDTTTIVDEYTANGFRVYRVTTHGKFMYHNKDDDKNTMEGHGITTTFLGPQIVQDSELELKVTA